MKSLTLLLCLLLSNCGALQNEDDRTQGTSRLPQGLYQVTYIEGNAINSERPLTLKFFKENNTVTGFAGCNTYGCSYELSGPDKLSFGMVRATRMYCAETSETESTFFQALSKTNTYRLKGNQLTLMNGPQVVITANASQ